MNSKEIRRLIMKSGLYLYQVAEEIGISDPTMTRWLRKLDEEKTERILKAIDSLVQAEQDLQLAVLKKEVSK